MAAQLHFNTLVVWFYAEMQLETQTSAGQSSAQSLLLM